MKSTKRKRVIKKSDGSFIKNGHNWTDESHKNFRDYQTKFNADTYRTFMFRVRRDSEAELIKFCESQDNFAGLMVSLIKGEMTKEGIVSSETFVNHQDAAVKIFVTFYLANEKIDFSQYIMPNLKEIPQISPKYRCEIISAGAKSVTLAISYLQEYSIPEIVNEVGKQLELYIRDKCADILTQFGSNPSSAILNREYCIENIDFVPGMAR